jgi:exodeoxyribonuclease-3
VKIATWNVNSIRTRFPLVVDFLHRKDIDVLLMQETKCRDDQFPMEAFSEAGYDVAHYGLNQWNGVGIASRLPLSAIEPGFSGMPGFAKDPEAEQVGEARAISATVEGIRLCSVYVPNGRSVENPHMAYKLQWLRSLGNAYGEYSRSAGALPFVIGGDFNVAPFDSDVGDPIFLEPGTTHTSAPEREALELFRSSAKVHDVVRPLIPEGFTFWDYKQGKFSKDHGLRIDFLYGSKEFSDQVVEVAIHRDERTLESPSDHVPVSVEIESPEGDDDRPMVF